MKNRKTSIVIAVALFLGASLYVLSGFIGYESKLNTPGVIQAIGDAGGPNTFTFRKWKFTEVRLPNDDFTQVKVGLEINISSLSTDWKKLEKSIRTKEKYFYVKKFPKANVNIEGATANEDGSYSAEAVLTLKGVTKSVPVTFTVSENKPYTIKGEGVMNRREWSFNGDGPKDEVPISFEVNLP